MALTVRGILPLTGGSNAEFRVRDLVGIQCLHDSIARHVSVAGEQVPPLGLEHRRPDMLADDEAILEVRAFARTGEDRAFALDADAVIAGPVDRRLDGPRVSFDLRDGAVEKVRAPLYAGPAGDRRRKHLRQRDAHCTSSLTAVPRGSATSGGVRSRPRPCRTAPRPSRYPSHLRAGLTHPLRVLARFRGCGWV